MLELNHNKIFLDENNNADGALLRDINLIVGTDKEYDYNYENKPKIKQNPTIQNGIKFYKRDKRGLLKELCNINSSNSPHSIVTLKVFYLDYSS